MEDPVGGAEQRRRARGPVIATDCASPSVTTARGLKATPIEHRLFSQIRRNWQGVPLETYDTALDYIPTPRIGAGLTAAVRLNSKRTRGHRPGDGVAEYRQTSHTTREELPYQGLQPEPPTETVTLFLRVP